MSFLLDTNVASEAIARRPRPEVVAWVTAQPNGSLYFSVGTIAEIDFGIARLPQGHRRSGLQEWRDKLVFRSTGRILAVDLRVAEAWAAVRARAEATKRTMAIIDSLIAATAEVHGLTVVTRNIRDFQGWGGPVFNPWPPLMP